MPEIHEVTVAWTGPQGGGLRNILYLTATSDNAARVRVYNLLNTIKPTLSNQYSFAVSQEVRHLESETGALISASIDPTAYIGGGGGNSQPVADTTQMLLKWSTDTVRLGRRVRGRTFIPGLSVGQLLSGNLNPNAVTAVQPALNAYVSTVGGAVPVIWSRPVGNVDIPGVVSPITGGSVWSELAVLRRRRG